MTDFRVTLESGCVCLDLKSTTKDAAIAEMIDLLVAAGKVKDREAVLRAVLDREARMSTGMQHGVAVPHGKTAAVDNMVTVLALKKQGLDFASLDGQPTSIFVMTISPINRTGPHVRYLAEISKFLESPALRERLLSAGSMREVLDVFT